MVLEESVFYVPEGSIRYLGWVGLVAIGLGIALSGNPSGPLLIGLGCVAEILYGMFNLEVELAPQGILITHVVAGIRVTRQVNYAEIRSIQLDDTFKNIVIRSKRGDRLWISRYIRRTSGMVPDIKTDPQMPAQGPLREIYNLKHEIVRRVRNVPVLKPIDMA